MSDWDTPDRNTAGGDASNRGLSDDDVIGMAPIVGLNALSPHEFRDIERAVAEGPRQVRLDFDTEVRSAREVMASVSAATAVPPPAALRERILAAAQAESAWIRSEPPDGADASSLPPAQLLDATVDHTLHRRRRLTLTASIAAAVVAVAIGAIGWFVGANSTSPSNAPTADQVFAAKDVRSSSGAVATGTATVTYSHNANAGVLVMNDVPPPKPGTVYQMWLTTPDGLTSVGTMTDKDVAPSTTAVIPNVGNASALSFTVEPPGGSPQPTSPVVASLPLR